MATFSDNFSNQASIYAQFRPSYPHELYDFLSSLTPQHQYAWDCGTGNGQSAIHLADYFEQVYATDPSDAQIANAFSHERVHYKVEKAEDVNLNPQSIDLITVAQAVHWFDFEKFYDKVKKVLKRDGIIAVWAYDLPQINNEIDPIIKNFYKKIVGPYWPEEIKSIDQGYTTIPFPFREIEPPEFYIRKRLKLEDLFGLLLSWSATQRYIAQEKKNPIDLIRAELSALWSDPLSIKVASWKIMLRVGKPSH
ncbi:class I SAM-dependent methyltransferase [Sphingobacterium sp. HJSM2_6]|uniref:class I SAM-dependent methyltransferase n=1 Tax=Sphingobacterium sp. HJSM2_6 TaxID=3366264 RepID=UPI003BC86B63